MYNYLMKVSAAKPKYKIDDALAQKIEECCSEVKTNANAIRKGYVFSYEGREDDTTVLIRLTSATSVQATRTISTITRALIGKVSKKQIADMTYNKNILNAKIVEQSEDSYENLSPTECAQIVIEILFDQANLGNNNKKVAKESAEAIKNICRDYKKKTSTRY